MPSRRTAACLVAALALQSCSSFGPRPSSIADGLTLRADRNGKDAPTSDAIAEAVWRELDIGNKPTSAIVAPADYQAAGYTYVYRKCSKYFDLLILEQNRIHFYGDVNDAGKSGSTEIMAALTASQAAIGAVAAGFGFTGALFSAFDKRALLTPYPSETKTLILNSLDAYRSKYPPSAAKAPADAVVNVEHYAELCTYSGITRAAEQALATASGSVETAGAAQPKPKAAAAAHGKKHMKKGAPPAAAHDKPLALPIPTGTRSESFGTFSFIQKPR